MPSTDTIERRLLRGGYRVTAPRRVLLDAIHELGEHFTAEQVLARAPSVGRATVFRTLRLLQDLGAVCQVILDDGTAEYRLSSVGHHHHIVCSECGAIDDFASCDIGDLLEELSRRTGFDIAAHRLEVYGRCARCQSALPLGARG